MKITLKDGSIVEFDEPKSIIGIAESISAGLARAACAGRVNGEVKDLRTVLTEDAQLEILTANDAEGGLSTLRHTTSHVMAQAIKHLYPDAKLAIGPSIADGFYYDIDFVSPVTADDLPKIEDEMKKIIKEDLALERFELPREEALKFMEEKEEPYKVQLIQDLPEDAVISFYKQGDFTDLCAGPHLMSTKGVGKAFKLTSIAGAYWRGDAKNKMLTRIYGTAFAKKEDLEAHLRMLEEAKKRDHRRLGKELGLFMLSDYGPGFPFFLPKGIILKNTLLEHWRKVHKKNGYTEISTPIILNRVLPWSAGSYNFVMNCPGSIIVYQSEPRSYRDLPLRLAELGIVHRNEKSGQLHGLMRVRCFTQDDSHTYITQDQIKDEVRRIVEIVDGMYKLFNFTYGVELSTRPEDSMGTDEEWAAAENGLKDALDALGLPYTINEGDGAFYGPKIDFHLVDCLGRTWQCATIQLDFQLPQRFELEYTGEDGKKHRPIMIHRVVFGSVERFIGILTEHFAGAFPTWLAPVQVKVLPISDKFEAYAKQVEETLDAAGIRAEIDLRSEKIGYKIREAQLQKIPYMLVVGQKEEEAGLVSVRSRFAGDEGQKTLADFLGDIQEEIREKTIRENTLEA